MRSRYKIAELESPHFITCTIVGWLPVFTRQKYLDIITASLSFCRQQKGLRLHAYVILDNHLHLVVSSDNLSQVIRDFKRHTAKEILAVARQEDKQWLLKQFEFFKSVHKERQSASGLAGGIPPPGDYHRRYAKTEAGIYSL